MDVPSFSKILSLTYFPTLPMHFCYSKEIYPLLPPLVHAILYEQTSSSQEALVCCSAMVNKVMLTEKAHLLEQRLTLLEHNSNKLILIFRAQIFY